MTDVTELLERLDALRERAPYGPVPESDYDNALEAAYPRLRAALLEMREENEELRVALQLLRALPVTGPACSREEHDGSVCEDCTAEREYRQRCIDVLAQADEALAKGGGR